VLRVTDEEYAAIIMGRLTPERVNHSVKVAEEAVRLAKKYGGDEKKANAAGLLHDIMKDAPFEVQLQTIEKYSIILDNVERAAPKLWHAISGAAVLKYELNVTDADILNAVRYHTTAREGMSLLEKIVYLADYISADRDYEGVNELKKAIYVSIRQGMQSALDFTICELLKKNAPIHFDTIRARNEISFAFQAEVRQ
jgi:predicted HD superfamily hydrolase involved in NAD metabolism